MDTCVMARVAIGLIAILLVAGCAVEVPKSVLPAFRLTPPTELTKKTKIDTSQPANARAANAPKSAIF